MKITLLGTGTSQGVPVIGCQCEVCLSSNSKDVRLRSSVIIEKDDFTVLVDTGPDLRQQFLNNDISSIDAIVYTHEHNDHVVGLDDIRPIYFRRQANIPSYALERVNHELKERFAYMFADKTFPGVAQLDTHDIDHQSNFTLGNISIQAIGINHGNLSILGYRFDNIAYITDASNIEPSEIEKLDNLDVLIINALQKKTHHSHFTLAEAIEYIQKIQPKQAFITHISHLMGREEEIAKELPLGITLAYDGLQIVL